MQRKFPNITSTAGILGGKPCIKGTRISVALILEWISNGSTISDIVSEFPQLSEQAVKEAIQYAAVLSENEVNIEIDILPGEAA